MVDFSVLCAEEVVVKNGFVNPAVKEDGLCCVLFETILDTFFTPANFVFLLHKRINCILLVDKTDGCAISVLLVGTSFVR